MCVALMGLQTNGKSGVHLEQASMAGPGLVAGLGKISVGSVGGCIDELVGHPPLEVEFMLATVFTSRWRRVAIYQQMSSRKENLFNRLPRCALEAVGPRKTFQIVPLTICQRPFGPLKTPQMG